jgi:hypothetical protein
MKTARMHTKQWVGAILALAAMVFVLTFAMNYLSSPSKSVRAPAADSPRLTFALSVFPPLQVEVNKAFFHDFWFENRNEDREVKLGLLPNSGKDLRVTRAELFVLPESKVSQLTGFTATRWFETLFASSAPAPTGTPADLAIPLGRLGRVAALAIAPERKTDSDLLEKLEGQPLNLEDTRKVPPRSIGWVRLHWATDKLGPTAVEVNLWTDHRQAEVKTVLQGQILVLPPLLVMPEIDVKSVDVSSLPRGLSVSFGSPTRSSLAVTVEVERDGRSEKSDHLVTAGQPQRLSEAECRELEKAFGGKMLLRCAYSFTLKLRDVSEDGTPVELGRFQRYLKLDAGEGVPKQRVVLEGLVQGDVQVGDRQEGGMAQLGVFPAEQGTKREIVVQSDVPGLQLEVDPARTAAFLEARLEKRDEAPSGHQTWVLTVRVPPGKVHGKFPNADEPVLRDSAVYLRRKGGPPRSIRIPVWGTAISG